MNENFEWEKFKNEINSLLEKGEIIYESKPKNKNEFDVFSENYKLWKTDVITFLTNSFSAENYFVQNFRFLNNNRYDFGNTSKPIEQQIKEKNADLNSDLRYINFIINMVSVSDILTKPNEIDLSIRQNYTSDEILELILEKLYDLYGDGIYPILQILEGNGITLKKRREEFDYVSILEQNGYVNSNNIAREADAQLTLNGKIYIEEKRRLTVPNYSSINYDNEELSIKIDDLKIQLEKLGFGQQIIFEELEELKEYYTYLNKQSWAQLFKGKLIDLGLSQVINADIMKLMYESIVHDTLRIQ
jgi:hypothetical protein